jgi:hypothetical protein
MITATTNTTNLAKALGGLREALIASGQSGDAAVIVKDESRRLATEISNQTPPKKKATLERKIGRDVGGNFSILTSNIPAAAQGNKQMRWLVAGPRFLYGVPPSHDLRSGTADLLSIHRGLRKRGSGERTKKLFPLGQRGKQHVYRVNRYIVTPKAIASLRRTLAAKIGRMKASWAATAIALGEATIPAWVRKHIPSPKAVTDLSGLSRPASPSVLFGSRSPGVSRTGDMVRRATQVRLKKVIARIRLILNGYKQDIAQGKAPRKHGKESARVSS